MRKSAISACRRATRSRSSGESRTGTYCASAPLAAYSTDIGFGAGARVYYYWNGRRDDRRSQAEVRDTRYRATKDLKKAVRDIDCNGT